MKRPFLLFVLYFFGCSSVFSQSPVWKIEGNGTTIYVGGSIHILREQDYPLPEEFESAFDNSKILVLEIDLNPDKGQESRKEFFKLTKYPPNKTLKTELSRNVYEKLDSAFTTYGLSLNKMDGYKPVIAILTLIKAELRKTGMGMKGIDKYFFEKGIESGRNAIFLESNDYQTNMFAQFGNDTQDKYVLFSLKELEYYKEIDSIIEDWRKGNTKEMLNWINSYKNDYPELYNSLLVERNNSWIPHFEDYLKTTQVEFVIVGAVHLYGQDGILQLMKDRGYKVQALKL